MIHTAVWFGRQFTFDNLPLWMYANVVERLRGTPARLEDRLGALPAELLTRRDDERWSAQEHAGHLLDLGWLDHARLADYAGRREVLTAADVGNRKTHEARHNENSIGNILAAFRADRGELVRRLDELDEEFVSRSALHPRLQKPMRVIDWLFFVAEHDDHHLARITELLRKSAR